MTVVVDANVLAALVLSLPYSDQATYRVTAWKRAEVDLCAPQLMEYEVGSALRKAVIAGLMTSGIAAKALHELLALDIRCFPPTAELHESAMRWAGRLGQAVVYDAHYVALAEQLRAELWTADKRLVNGARQAGVPWVHWIGTE